MFVANFHTDNQSDNSLNTQKKHTHTKNNVAGQKIRNKILHIKQFTVIFIYESRWSK